MKRKKRNLAIHLQCFLIINVIIVFLGVNAIAGDVYHVSAKGSKDGSSVEDFCNLSFANNNLKAGDIAYLYDDDGVFPERINPVNNGTAGNLIIYIAADGEKPIISTQNAPDESGKQSCIAIMGSETKQKQYIRIENVTTKNLTTDGTWRFFNVEWAHHIYFKDCVFEAPIFGVDGRHESDARSSSVDYSNHIYFDNCTWDGATFRTDQNAQPNLMSIDRSKHCLFIRCTFGDVAHSPVQHQNGTGESEYNAFINCTFTNRWRRAYALIVDNYKEIPDRWLFQGNVMANVGWDNQNCPWVRDRDRLNTSYFDSRNFIVRENIYYGCDIGINIRSMTYTDMPIDNYLYHNTIYNCKRPAGNSIGGIPVYLANLNVGFEGNVLINNIFWGYDGDVGKSEDYQVFLTISKDKPSQKNNIVTYNSFGRRRDKVIETYIKWGGISGSLSRIEDTHSEWYDNVLADPGFIDADNPNFKRENFTPTNPAIVDSAKHLTLTNGSGTSSKTLIVDNASYFFSGPYIPWLLEGTESDTIYIEDSGAVMITSIDYETNTLKLEKNMTWANNKKVFHKPYSGLAPDIGAVEKSGPPSTVVTVEEYKE